MINNASFGSSLMSIDDTQIQANEYYAHKATGEQDYRMLEMIDRT